MSFFLSSRGGEAPEGSAFRFWEGAALVAPNVTMSYQGTALAVSHEDIKKGFPPIVEEPSFSPVFRTQSNPGL
jgi:hypothetical protein